MDESFEDGFYLFLRSCIGANLSTYIHVYYQILLDKYHLNLK